MVGNPSRRHRFAFPHPYPFIAAVITVTALVAANPDEGILWANVYVPAVSTILVALVGWALGTILVRDRERQSAIAFLISLPLLTSGYLFGWIPASASSAVFRDSTELVLTTAFIVGGAWLIRRFPAPPSTVSRFMNAMTALLLVFTVPAILSLSETVDMQIPAPAVLHAGKEAFRPDIYLLVLDAYTGTESLQSIYGFDNTPMLDSLRQRGFRIPNRPRANYTKTFLSVGTMLNRRYADDLAQLSAPDFKDRGLAYQALEFNQSAIDFKHLGYEFVYVGSSYPPMADNRLSDTRRSPIVSREFEAVWVGMTIIAPAKRVTCRLISCPLADGPFAAEDAAGTERQLRILHSSVLRPGPKFVYAHLLLPHGPFRFGPSCEHRSSVWDAGSTMVPDSLIRSLYIDQVECTNRKILEIVDAIRAESGDSSVILLQADHGYARFSGGIPAELESAMDDQVRERFDVFAAYAGPGSLADSLAAHRTPVNLFRTLFRVLWGAEEPPLDERHYWSGGNRPMLLEEVLVD